MPVADAARPAVTPEEADEFVGRFAEAWADPSPERLSALCHPDALLVAPLTPRTSTREASDAMWRDVFAGMPDLRVAVVRWAPVPDGVFIQIRLRATVGRRPFEWTAVDRIVLEDGLVRERVSHFDPTPLVLETLKAPAKWPAMLKLQLRRG